MNRDELSKALEAQPFDTDVQVNVGGLLIDVTRVDFDRRRHSIVIDVLEEDADEAMQRFLRVRRRDTDAGKSR